MPTIAKEKAIDRLTAAIGTARSDDLVEIHNELFPEQPVPHGAADQSALSRRILRHVSSGLEVEEILDLWNVVFPAHHDVWFDEDEGLVHYAEDGEPVGHIDA